jgi:hypothetical protein
MPLMWEWSLNPVKEQLEIVTMILRFPRLKYVGVLRQRIRDRLLAFFAQTRSKFTQNHPIGPK